jgi:hypothetical protein
MHRVRAGLVVLCTLCGCGRPPRQTQHPVEDVPLAFYETSIGALPETVAATIPVPLLDCTALARSYPSENEVPLDLAADCELRGIRAVDRLLAERTKYLFARGLRFLTGVVDVSFNFRDGRLFSVNAVFRFADAVNARTHYSDLLGQMLAHLGTSQGTPSIEESKQVPGAQRYRYWRAGASTTIWANPAPTIPILSITVVDAARSAREQSAPSTAVQPDAAPSVAPARVTAFPSGWYCIKSVDVEDMSTCFKTSEQCAWGLQKFAVGGLRYVGCLPQKRAACFSFYAKLQGTDSFDCSATITACQRQRASMLSARADFDDVRACTSWN